MTSDPQSQSTEFTHVRGGAPSMVDVAEKPVTRRSAEAVAFIALAPEVMRRLADGEIHAPKGPVFHTAIIAATMAVKNTGNLIPFCHPLPIEGCEVWMDSGDTGVAIHCKVTTTGKTGVEMEAMTGASVAALTIYDMTKALDKGAAIREIRLIAKSGGKSGDYRA